eukprot:5325982-Pleurochrysis_carterae.AAC.4
MQRGRAGADGAGAEERPTKCGSVHRSAAHLCRAHVGQRRRHPQVLLLAVAEAAVASRAPGEDDALVGDGDAVRGAARDAHDALAHQLEDALWRRLRVVRELERRVFRVVLAVGAVAQHAKLAPPPRPRVAVAIARQVEIGAAGDRRDRRQPWHVHGRRLRLGLLADVAADAALLGRAAAVHAPVACHEDRVRLAGGRRRDRLPCQRAHTLGTRTRDHVAVTELPRVVAAPRESLAVCTKCHNMRRRTTGCNVGKLDTTKALAKAMRTEQIGRRIRITFLLCHLSIVNAAEEN